MTIELFNIITFHNPLRFTYGMFLDFSHWTTVSEVTCPNSEEHTAKLETLTDCQRLCVNEKNCIGVSFSNYWTTEDRNSHCYFCRDADTLTDKNYDVYLRPGKP